MERKTVLLLFGGESSEHDVSISSARNVYAAIDDTQFEVELCYIDRQGTWWLLDEMDSVISTDGSPKLVPMLGDGSLQTIPAGRTVTPHVLLPILHGKNGEDGSIAALGQLLHIPVVGCDMTSSAICMDKVATKQIAERVGIHVVPYEVHRINTPAPDFSQLSMKYGLPLFVKPSRAGSSVGVSKVFSEEEFLNALDEAHIHDNVALIETGVTAREIEVAILGNPPHHDASVVGEINPDGDFYTYDSKYSQNSASEVIIPAQLDDEKTNEIQTIAKKIYETIGCSGLSRVDFFLLEDKTVYLNEINTIPGFTNISMYPKLWREGGVTYSHLVERLLNLAMEPKKVELKKEV